MTLEKFGVLVGIVVGLLGIWEAVARIAGANGPVTIVQDVGDGQTTTNFPTITTGDGKELDAPSGVSLSGDCESGFTLTWQPVDGAEKYRIEEDGTFSGVERDTSHSIHPFPDGKEHTYQVFAEAFPESRSEGSSTVSTEACSF